MTRNVIILAHVLSSHNQQFCIGVSVEMGWDDGIVVRCWQGKNLEQTPDLLILFHYKFFTFLLSGLRQQLLLLLLMWA